MKLNERSTLSFLPPRNNSPQVVSFFSTTDQSISVSLNVFLKGRSERPVTDTTTLVSSHLTFLFRDAFLRKTSLDLAARRAASMKLVPAPGLALYYQIPPCC
jgi:hypothetical protein